MPEDSWILRRAPRGSRIPVSQEAEVATEMVVIVREIVYNNKRWGIESSTICRPETLIRGYAVRDVRYVEVVNVQRCDPSFKW